jgi:hypothetical protein
VAIHAQGGKHSTYHVVGLEDLTLVGSSVSVQGESTRLLLEVLLGEGDTGADGDLGSDNTVSTEEGWSENVHRTSLSKRHSINSA